MLVTRPVVRRAAAITVAAGVSLGLGLASAQAAEAPVLNGAPTLTQGSRGVYVVALQRQLVRAGDYQLDGTGYFGPATKTAVIDWQKRNKISPAAGTVGPKTWASLAGCRGLDPNTFSLKATPGQKLSRDQAVELQNVLNQLDQDFSWATPAKLPATQRYTGDAVTMIKRFQARAGLPAQGVLGSKTNSALGIVLANDFCFGD